MDIPPPADGIPSSGQDGLEVVDFLGDLRFVGDGGADGFLEGASKHPFGGDEQVRGLGGRGEAEAPDQRLVGWGRRLVEGRTEDAAKEIAGSRLCRDAGIDAINVPDGPRARRASPSDGSGQCFFGRSPPVQAMNSHLPFSLIITSVYWPVTVSRSFLSFSRATM